MSDLEKRLQERLIEGVVLLDRQCRMIARLVETNSEALRRLEQKIGTGSVTLDDVLDAYNYVFGLVDHFARYQKIATALPRLNQKSPEHRALKAALGDISDARDQLQHINNDIENDNSGPLLGGICWVSEETQYLLSLNDVARQRSNVGIVYDTHNDRHLSAFCFTYGKTYYDLEKALGGIAEFNRYVLRTVQIQVGGKPYDPAQHFAALSMRFVRLEGEQPDAVPVSAPVNGSAEK